MVVEEKGLGVGILQGLTAWTPNELSANLVKMLKSPPKRTAFRKLMK